MTHQIGDNYTVRPVGGSLAPHTDYQDVLRNDFSSHYRTGGDVWTEEIAMSATPQALLNALEAGHCAHVCDVGAGRGRDTELLLAQGHRVTAIDLVASPEWKRLASIWGDRVRFLELGLLDVPGQAAFDAVLDNGCLHHQHPTQYNRYLRRVNELLRTGGLFAVSVFRATRAPGQLYANSGNRLYREFTEQELNELVEREGFLAVDAIRVPRHLPDLCYLVAIYRKIAGA
jgi:SAM-dependent methyltransferase